MAKVTGIGGVFFKSKSDPAILAAWYQKHLGMPLEQFGGAVLRWPEDRAEDKGLTLAPGEARQPVVRAQRRAFHDQLPSR
jgi:hypothetical protein